MMGRHNIQLSIWKLAFSKGCNYCPAKVGCRLEMERVGMFATPMGHFDIASEGTAAVKVGLNAPGQVAGSELNTIVGIAPDGFGEMLMLANTVAVAPPSASQRHAPAVIQSIGKGDIQRENYRQLPQILKAPIKAQNG